KSTNKILIVALIIGSFLLGSLTNKVATLEKTGSSDPANVKGAAIVPADNQQPPAQPATGKIKPVTSAEHIKGNANAKVTLVVYSDFECPFCQKFHPTTQELLKAYGDKIRLVFRHYPLPFHANAQKEAEAAECIAELGGNDLFWKYVDVVFERTTATGTGIELDKLGPMATELGVNQEAFQTCLDSGKYEKLIKESITEGQSAGVNGTPSTFIINSKDEAQIMVGAQPIEAFKTIIDQELNK
ncbi:MAG: DsbA family protein, partial [Candidatus Levybacteria bacterium]|nr:DsbA family protein [Candidatus Levybacteria bacterium]